MGTEIAPACVPLAVGVKVAEMMQLPPAAMVLPTAGQVPVPPKAKGPEIVKPAVIVIAELVLLVSVEVPMALVVPTVVLGNVSGLGERLTEPPPVDEAPVPLRPTVRALPLPGVIVRVAVSVPVTVGLKVTLMVQLPLAATLEPQVFV